VELIIDVEEDTVGEQLRSLTVGYLRRLDRAKDRLAAMPGVGLGLEVVVQAPARTRTRQPDPARTPRRPIGLGVISKPPSPFDEQRVIVDPDG
jgi:hypothetical protein